MLRDLLLFAFWVVSVCPPISYAITTTHHDKPEESTIPIMATKMVDQVVNVTLSSNEREKRLLPYENFYLSQSENQYEPQDQYRYQFDGGVPKKVYPLYNEASYQQDQLIQQQDVLYQNNNKYTPFMESNAIPGPFRPITANRQPVQYVTQSKVPDYSTIYDKLSQLKLQNTRRPIYVETYRKPQVNFVPPNRYNDLPATTTIETFVATNIDIPNERYNPPQAAPSGVTYLKRYQGRNKPYVNPQIAVEIPQSSYPQQNYQAFLVRKPYQGEKGRPFILLQPRPEDQRVNLQSQPLPKPILVIQRKPVYNKPVGDEKYDPVTFLPQYEDKYQPQYVTPKYEEYVTVPRVTEAPVRVATENTNGLSQILKQLQASNTLPQTLTPDNIDNSIKTLVKILEALKKRQKLSKPIVVQDDVSDDYNEGKHEADVDEHIADVPGTVTQSFPGVAPDGGTPGKPGVDYPALSTIPQTSFNCKTQRYKGFFGDPDTNCQVWHYCDLNGGQASFLCPNGTIFSQVALTCDWWYNVKCSATPQQYVLNERLYKYIIPLSPKFPEDYSGPLVDKYLALKFQEMEEKMKKEKASKEKEDSKEKESEELQDIDSEEEIVKPHERPKKPTTKAQERETLETVEDDNQN